MLSCFEKCNDVKLLCNNENIYFVTDLQPLQFHRLWNVNDMSAVFKWAYGKLLQIYYLILNIL